MSNPFRYSKRKRTLNRPKYDEEPPPLSQSIFMKKYLPVALLNGWITCDTLGCYDVPSINFGPFTESGDYTTGVSSNGESKILVRIPPRQYYFNANGKFTIDNDAGSGSEITVDVNTGGGGCNYEHFDFICNEREFVFDHNICLSAGSTVNFATTPDQCPYIVSHLSSDTSVYRFTENLALAAGSTITFSGNPEPHIPFPVPLMGIMHVDNVGICPLEFYSFNQFRLLPPEARSVDFSNAATSYPAYMVLVEVYPDIIFFRFYRNDCDVNPIVLEVSENLQYALFGIIEHDSMPNDLYISVLAVASNTRTFILSTVVIRKEDVNVPESIICFSTTGYKVVYNPS